MHFSQPFSRMSVIARPKTHGGGEHWGVLLPDGSVAHNTPERGEHISTLAEFAANLTLRVVRDVPPAHFYESVERIRIAVQSPTAQLAYHPTKNNCQSFANRVTGEAPRSPAVEGVGLLALAGLFVWALARAE
jgi:hypothetical protein